MKKIIVIIFLFGGAAVKAQSETVKAMTKQIALVQLYIGYLQKGYHIAKKGLTDIADIRNGHLKLDTDFFNSLKQVNPKIKRYSKVAAIVSRQAAITKECNRLKKQNFNKDEISYVNSIVSHLLRECETVVDHLAIVLTNERLQMSDDERIQAIDSIYATVEEQYYFIRSFSGQAKQLIQNRAKEKNDAKVSKQLQGI